VIVIVLATVIVAVHENGNDTVIVIPTLDDGVGVGGYVVAPSAMRGAEPAVA